ncbi:MAG: winged helix-turn-helix transcriptional regulator [Deltaproteobacteria bacterium]|nr:winged helix-turn-helix transcriptional regulator [Deltaproteobacteria bacterium]
MAFKVLSDETILRILNLLNHHGEISESCIAGILKMRQPNISKHLAYLKSAGFIKNKRNGSGVYYSLSKNDFLLSLIRMSSKLKKEDNGV